MTYTVVLLREAEGGYSVTVPALPGCFSEGDTVLEALDMARDAILCHVASLRKHGEVIPEDTGRVSFDLGESGEAFAYRVDVQERREFALA